MRYYLIAFLTCCTALLSAQTANDSTWQKSFDEQQLTDSTTTQRYDYHFHQGQQKMLHSDFRGASEEYLRCIAIDPSKAQAYFEQSKMLQFLGDAEQARSYLKQAILHAPENDYYKEIEAAYCIQTQEYGKAIQIFEQLVRNDKSNDTYLYQLIDLYAHLKQYDKYLNALDRLEVLHGISETISMAKIEVYETTGKSKKVIAELNRLIAKFPFDTRYKVYLSDYYFSINQSKKALTVLNDVLTKHPKDGYASLAMFAYNQNIGETAKADSYLHTAIQNREVSFEDKMDHLRPYLVNLIQQNRTVEVDSIFTTLTTLYTDEPSLFDLYGDYLMQQKLPDAAETQYKRAASLDYVTEDYWTKLAQLQIGRDSIAALQQTASEAELLFPNNITWAYYRVVAAYQLKQNDSIPVLTDRYVKHFTPGNDEFCSLLLGMYGDYLTQEKGFGAAIAYYDSALVVNPRNVVVLNNLAYHLALCETDLRRAERMSGKAVEAEPQNATYLDTYAWVFFMSGDYHSAKFYMERALNYDKSGVLLEHYGDILFMYGNVDKAVETWLEAQKAGDASELLKQKIEEKRYIPEETDCKGVKADVSNE